MNDNVSMSQTATEQGSVHCSSEKQRTKKRKWWMTELFEMRPKNDPSTGNASVFFTCKGCSWYTKAVPRNTSRIGEHLVRCTGTSAENRKRLLEDERLNEYYRKHLDGGGSNLFGFPVTPSIKKNRKRFTCSSKSIGTMRTSENPVGSQSDLEIVGEQQLLLQKAQARSENESKFNMLLTQFFVKHMLPFSLLSRKEGSDDLYRLISLANPSLAQQLPDPQRMGSKNICRYFKSLKERVKEGICATLKESFGTLIFDGWTDSNRQSVVNVLLSVTGAERIRKTFFLKSIYTGSKTCDAAYYAKIVEDSLSEFGDIKRVCAVVSDNTSACVKAKETLLAKYNHMIVVQDQTHLANLLMEDLGKLFWVKQILSMVSAVVVDLRNHLKLYHRFKELKMQHNRTCTLMRSSSAPDKYGRVQLPPRAILPCAMAVTRFASSESMVASFLRSKVVLLNLIECPDFSTQLYGDRNREKRDLFKATIRDESLYDKLLDIYHVLRLVRQYLRIFDDESSFLSEVYPATIQLLTKLKQLPLTPFYTAERSAEVIRVFEQRLHGEGRKIALVTPLHRVAYILDLRSLRENIAEFRPHLVSQIMAFVRSDCFPMSEKFQSDGGEDGAVERICQEFIDVRSVWRSQVQDPVLRHSLRMYNRSPANYWMDYEESSLLREFALRDLCSSPSSSSVERSFSLQARKRTSTRNRLHQNKVSKLIFCAFNESLLHSRERTIRKLEKKDYASLRFGSASEAIPASGGGESANRHLYSKFLENERITCDAIEDGADDMDLEDLEVLRCDFTPTSEAVGLFPEIECQDLGIGPNMNTE